MSDIGRAYNIIGVKISKERAVIFYPDEGTLGEDFDEEEFSDWYSDIHFYSPDEKADVRLFTPSLSQGGGCIVGFILSSVQIDYNADCAFPKSLDKNKNTIELDEFIEKKREIEEWLHNFGLDKINAIWTRNCDAKLYIVRDRDDYED